MRGVITLGLYDLASSGVEADATGNYNRFQEDSGGFLFGAVLPYAPGAARSVGRAGVNLGREAGPFLNPGNYRLNPNSLQSFSSVPLEFRGPTFTRPSGAGPVPFGLEGPTVIQSPTLSGPVTVTGPVAAGSPALTPGAGIAGGTRVVPPAGGTPQRGTFRVIEVDRNVMDLEIMTADGKTINVLTDFEVQGDKLILKQFHVGERLRRGDIGPRELKDSLEAFAQEIGRQYGVKSVRIEGGIRKAGTDNPRYPRPIEIEVK